MKAAIAILVALAGTAHAGRHCHETSPVVGYRQCGEFGSRWAHRSLDDLSISFMTSTFIAERVVLPDLDHTDDAYTPGDMQTHYRTRLAGSHAFWAYGYRSGIAFHGPHLRLAFELAALFGRGPALDTETDGVTVVDANTAAVLELGGSVGTHVRRGRLDVGVEAGVHWRAVELTPGLPAGYRGCPTEDAKCEEPFVGVNQLIVEPRVRADVWLTPQITLGLVGGADVLLRDETIALAFMFHINAFDGS